MSPEPNLGGFLAALPYDERPWVKPSNLAPTLRIRKKRTFLAFASKTKAGTWYISANVPNSCSTLRTGIPTQTKTVGAVFHNETVLICLRSLKSLTSDSIRHWHNLRVENSYIPHQAGLIMTIVSEKRCSFAMMCVQSTVAMRLFYCLFARAGSDLFQQVDR